jgi:hypothetical protein
VRLIEEPELSLARAYLRWPHRWRYGTLLRAREIEGIYEDFTVDEMVDVLDGLDAAAG